MWKRTVLVSQSVEWGEASDPTLSFSSKTRAHSPMVLTLGNPPSLLAYSPQDQRAIVTQTEREGLVYAHALTACCRHTHYESLLKSLLPRRAFFPSSATTLLTALSMPASPGRHNIQRTPQSPFSLKWDISEWFHCLLCLLKKNNNPKLERILLWH